MPDEKEKRRRMMADILRGPMLRAAPQPERPILWTVEIPEGARDIFQYLAVDNQGGVLVVMKQPSRLSLHVGGYGELFMEPIGLSKDSTVRLELQPLEQIK